MPPSVSADTHHFVDCWNDKNWDCVASFISKSELDGYGISRDQASKFIMDYCHPTLVGNFKLSNVSIKSEPMGQTFIAMSDDRIDRIDGMMVRSEGKTRFVDLITNLMGRVAVVKYGKNQVPSPDELGRAWLVQAQKDRIQLVQLGIVGFLQGNKIRPWDEWQRGLEEGIARRAVRAQTKH